MNAVEIEEAVSELALQPFEPKEFPFSFLEAFGNKSTTIKKLQSGSSNKTDVNRAILQRNNIHILSSEKGKVTDSLEALRNSPSTKKNKAEFILATDGLDFQAENIITGETIVCEYKDFHNYFGFFLSLANISTVKQIRESAFDIKATSRLNKLYVELLQHNPDWSSIERRHEMNHFLARLIFCFFAEDTDIFNDNLFTDTVQKYSASDASDTHIVISEMFRAMDTKKKDREKKKIKVWAKDFPYVNGELFSGSTEVPKFTKIARSYLLHVGSLDWKQINPDIFGSMIQAVADEDERGSLGMHYTSVPNIRKVLNPLFLDDLRDQLENAGVNSRKLLNLRNRIANIRVFDPACGSGNFLVIAYKDLRKIENEINIKRGETFRSTEIPLTNFRGIEIKSFSAEVARLALIIAEYQCDVLYRGQRLALAEFLPLDAQNWIVKGNALTLNWLSVCNPSGKSVEIQGDDLFSKPEKQVDVDFDNEGGETYICGNPPYKGSNWRTKEQTKDLSSLFDKKVKKWKALDYVTGWILKAAQYSQHTSVSIAFVTTNSICQGSQTSVLWPTILSDYGLNIFFAHKSFKWSNLASHNAGVSVIIIGLTNITTTQKKLFDIDANGDTHFKEAENINAYLLNAQNVFIRGAKESLSLEYKITDGSGALDGGNLILSNEEKEKILNNSIKANVFLKPYIGSNEFIKSKQRWCIWVEDKNLKKALEIPEIASRIAKVRVFRENAGTRAKTAIERPHKFAWINKKLGAQIIIPTVFSEKREYITAGYLNDEYIISNSASIIQEPELYVFSIISSKVHMAWVRGIAGRLEDRIRYTSSTCYNTFPLIKLTNKNKQDLTTCAEEILIARERHFPATIADLYDPEKMPEDLRLAHKRNDEVLERIYIGRKFKNDTERLEKLFQLYTKMTSKK